jgi:hypothetical protein
MTDFRALCARMADELDHYRQLLMDDRRATHALATEARAALEAQPEPQGPTDAELITMWATTRYIDQPEGGLAYGRAVLTRWGRPAIEPVPVSERLPGPEDCDEEGLCWWWDPDCRQTEAWCRGLSEYASGSYSHWLPHWALPVPKREAEQ